VQDAVCPPFMLLIAGLLEIKFYVWGSLSMATRPQLGYPPLLINGMYRVGISRLTTSFSRSTNAYSALYFEDKFFVRVFFHISVLFHQILI